jgi:hypothetical protein
LAEDNITALAPPANETSGSDVSQEQPIAFWIWIIVAAAALCLIGVVGGALAMWHRKKTAGTPHVNDSDVGMSRFPTEATKSSIYGSGAVLGVPSKETAIVYSSCREEPAVVYDSSMAVMS